MAFKSLLRNPSLKRLSTTSDQVRAKMDPLRRQVPNFLQNISQYEEELDDTLSSYYLEEGQSLPGMATVEGTEHYHKRSQSEDSMFQVHHDNFKSPFNSAVKVTTIGVGSYVGGVDDLTDYLMYSGMKTSILSGGVNHIDTAPNYRYQKSERTIGKLLQTLS